MMDPQWLRWAKQLQAIAQNGLTFGKDPFDIERYESLRQLTVEIMATHSDADLRAVRDLFAREDGYATPKVAVLAAVFQGDTILLVKGRRDHLWTVPGGWADVGETPSDAIVREVREESGYETKAVKLLALHDRDSRGLPPLPFHVYTLFFRCELIGGEASTSIETEDVGFFKEDDVPDLSISRVTPDQVRRLFEHQRNPDWPTDFD